MNEPCEDVRGQADIRAVYHGRDLGVHGKAAPADDEARDRQALQEIRVGTGGRLGPECDFHQPI